VRVTDYIVSSRKGLKKTPSGRRNSSVGGDMSENAAMTRWIEGQELKNVFVATHLPCPPSHHYFMITKIYGSIF